MNFTRDHNEIFDVIPQYKDTPLGDYLEYCIDEIRDYGNANWDSYEQGRFAGVLDTLRLLGNITETDRVTLKGYIAQTCYKKNEEA